MKKFLMLLLLLLPLTITSCGSDDKDEPNVPNEPNSTTQSNYTATTSVKTVTIHDKEESYNNGDNSNGGVTFYEDYNNKYTMALCEGCIKIYHAIRMNGVWIDYNDDSDYYNHRFFFDEVYTKLCGIISMGQVSSITQITEKGQINGYGLYYTGGWYSGSDRLWYISGFQPNHGYVVLFTTENNEEKYMRIYAEKYTLDSNGSLSTITVKYQLF